VNGLPDTNRGFDDDYLVVSGEWFLPGRRCPTKDGVPGPFPTNIVFSADLQLSCTDPYLTLCRFQKEKTSQKLGENQQPTPSLGVRALHGRLGTAALCPQVASLHGTHPFLPGLQVSA
jgi:hypothetical protein